LTRWTSKKPFWPFVGALGCLFLLAVAAPSSWHRYQPASQSVIEEIIASEPAVSEPVQMVVALEPINELAPPNLRTPVQDVVTQNIVAPPIEDLLPTQQKFDFDVLLQMRDALISIVDRLPNQQQLSETKNAEPSVQVTSENDRLAMLDTRHRRRVERPSRNE